MEIWKTIFNYYNYEISSYGRIRNINGYIRKIQTDKKGYSVISIRNYLGIRKTLKIHRLVAIMFLDNPKNLPQINHKDGNKKNNKVDNLEWCNNSYNQKHAFLNNLQINKGSKNPRSKLSEENVIEIRKNGKYDTYLNISKKYKVSKSTIYSILNNKNWKNL